MQTFVDWLKHPFTNQNGQVDAVSLFLAVGLVIVMIGAWGLIFKLIREAA